MNIDNLIPPTDLRDYAKDKGWVLFKEAAKDRLYVMTNPHFEHRQLVFPMDTTAPDYSESVMLVVSKLSDLEGRSTQAVIKSPHTVARTIFCTHVLMTFRLAKSEMRQQIASFL